METSNVLIVGPIFDTPSGPKGIGGSLYLNLKQEGFTVFKRSSIINKYIRFIDIIFTIYQKRNHFNIILLQGFAGKAFVMEDFVSRLAAFLKKPIVYTIHGGAFNEFYERHPIWSRKVLSRMTVINTPSNFLQSYLIEKGHQVEYAPNFIALAYFLFGHKIQNPHSLLWVRSFHDIYHPELAIETVELLKDKYPNVHLTMIGPDQGTRKQCEALIQSRNLERYISLLGVVPNHELSQYYHSHAIYLNTTRYESFGVALVEAGACGIPIISTKVGEIPHLWTDRQNILFADRTPFQFAEKVIRLFEDPQLCDTLRQNARSNVEKFTWENVRPYWLQKIKELTR